MNLENEDLDKAKHFYLIQKIKVMVIEKTELGSFDIFDIYPDFGTKTSKLSSSLQDFALYMGCIGIPHSEFDNTLGCFRVKLQRRDIDRMLLSNAITLHSPLMLAPVVLGFTATGEPLTVDQAMIPNTLIAGSPGCGKSTLLRVIIENLLTSKIQVTIIDPKMIDFASFKDRKYCKVETNISNVGKILSGITDRMNSTYAILSKRNFSSIAENNKSVTSNSQKLMPEVLVIDEWADVMLLDKANLKKMLLLSQKGRAAGISIVLATQRPSAGIFPGQIKANFSGRIAMRVSSELESRIIINSSQAAHISEPGMAYYLDQNRHEPIYFRVATNDIENHPQRKESKSFLQTISDIFTF